MSDPGLPLAIRATAEVETSLLGRKRPKLRFDARFDGHVVRGVNVDDALQGQRFPADAWLTREAAEVACPGNGPGDWVEYATGRRPND